MVARYDAVVIGLGGMGSATAYHLARRGWSVLGLEQYDLLHERGSSHGLTRIIRLAYHEDPSYVPLLRRAYELWGELETAADEALLVTTGSLEGGPEDGDTFQGALQAAALHDLPHEVLNAYEAAYRFPAFRALPPETRLVYQPDGGFLLAERCVLAHVKGAIAHGAELRFREPVRAWEPTADGGVRVTTERGVAEASRLVVCAGPWARQMVPALDRLAVPERQVLAWLQPVRPELFAPAQFPVFLIVVEDGSFYGFPVYDVPGFKFGKYHHRLEPIDPDSVDRSAGIADERVLRAFAERYFPDGAGPTLMLKTCIFTNSPDEHFIIDLLPGLPQVSVAAGFSGHGFKFCSVIGEIMADLAQHARTAHDIGLFKLSRFAS